MEVRQRRQIEPVDLLLDPVVLVKQAADAANPTLTRGAQAQLMTLVRVALDIMPGRTRRETLRSRSSGTRNYALIVGGGAREALLWLRPAATWSIRSYRNTGATHRRATISA